MTAEAPTLLDVVEDRGSHPSHSGDRIWPETNCYLDLWIELLHTLGHDPVPMYACALSADHDGEQWTFVKPDPADIRDLYGLQVAEETCGGRSSTPSRAAVRGASAHRRGR